MLHQILLEHDTFSCVYKLNALNYLPKSRPLNFFQYIENFENNIQILNINELNIKLMGINYSKTQDQVQHK